MAKLRILFFSFLVAFFGMQLANHAIADKHEDKKTSDRQTAYLMEVKGAIGPAVTDYIKLTFELAEKRDADMVVIEMHTPGGLVTSMQDIIQEIIAAPFPVITYVSPSGSHAASAGTYILYGSHIAAMAPATNLGAATPVGMGQPGPAKEEKKEEDKSKDKENKEDEESKKAPANDGEAMKLKSVNDAVAYIRGLAELRGRNADWAEKAVREAVSLNAKEALKKNVIDIVAKNLDDLMTQINGRTVEVNGEDFVIQSDNVLFVEAKPNWRTKLLMIITNPNVAFFFMSIGFYGLIYEFANPGAMVPGIVGVICLCVGLFALNVLPVNYAGVALLLLGIGMMVAESFVPSFGVLGIAGAIAFALGGTMLFEKAILGFGVSWQVIAVTTAISVALLVFMLSFVLKAHKKKTDTGEEGLIGAEGRIKEWSGSSGVVLTYSEDWTAFNNDGEKFKKGDKVYVISKNGLRLEVSKEKPLEEE